MNRESMRAFVEKAYAERDSGNVAGIVTAFRDDGVFHLAGDSKAFVLAGAIEGHPSLEQAMTQFTKDFTFSGRKILSFVADGDRAAVHSRLTVKHKNGTFETDILDLFAFKDGKIDELIEFADTAKIKQVAFG
jgi:ketosteroid isomerase-like protein